LMSPAGVVLFINPPPPTFACPGPYGSMWPRRMREAVKRCAASLLWGNWFLVQVCLKFWRLGPHECRLRSTPIFDPRPVFFWAPTLSPDFHRTYESVFFRDVFRLLSSRVFFCFLFWRGCFLPGRKVLRAWDSLQVSFVAYPFLVTPWFCSSLEFLSSRSNR